MPEPTMPAGVPQLTVVTTPPAKPWWQSRVLWVNAIALGLAAAESRLQLLQGVLPLNAYELLAFVLPVANAVLRMVTSTAIAPVALPSATTPPKDTP